MMVGKELGGLGGPGWRISEKKTGKIIVWMILDDKFVYTIKFELIRPFVELVLWTIE